MIIQRFLSVNIVVRIRGIATRDKLFVLLALVILCSQVFGQNNESKWLEQGNQLFSQGKYEEAIQFYDKLIEVDPQASSAWIGKGKSLDALGKYDEAIKCFEITHNNRNEGINWALTTIVTIILALSGYFLKYFYDLKLSKRASRLERINRQLGELYGPLYALAYSTTTTFIAFRAKYRPTYKSYFDKNSPPNDEELKIWRLWMSTVFMPNNLRMYELVLAKADLLIEENLPPCLLDLGAHVAAYKAVMKKWEEGNFSEHTSLIKFPSALRDYAKKSFLDLKHEQENLIGKSPNSTPCKK